MTITGNGTGPGTLFPHRRGPRAGKRLIRGPDPNEYREIILNLDGRWYEDADGTVRYCGGMTKYVHNVKPWKFHLGNLFQCCMRILRDRYGDDQYESHMPTRIWYQEHGVDAPAGLKIIQGPEGMEAMWKNAFQNSSNTVTVYVQDSEYDWDASAEIKEYVMPLSVPTKRGTAYVETYLNYADEYQAEDDEAGPGKIGLKEVMGKRWYISSNPVARAPIITNVTLRRRPGRQLSDVPIQINLWP